MSEPISDLPPPYSFNDPAPPRVPATQEIPASPTSPSPSENNSRRRPRQEASAQLGRQFFAAARLPTSSSEPLLAGRSGRPESLAANPSNHVNRPSVNSFHTSPPTIDTSSQSRSRPIPTASPSIPVSPSQNPFASRTPSPSPSPPLAEAPPVVDFNSEYAEGRHDRLLAQRMQDEAEAQERESLALALAMAQEEDLAFQDREYALKLHGGSDLASGSAGASQGSLDDLDEPSTSPSTFTPSSSHMTCEQCRKHFSYKYDLGQYTSDSTTSSSPWTLPLGTRLTCSQRHAVCSPCLYQHVASRLGTNTMPGGPLSPAGAIMSPVIGCLTCGEEISDEEALRVLPSHLIEPWCERKSQPIRIPSIMACPNPSCMGQIMQPEAWDNRAQQSCLACGTFVCVHCRSPWHNGMSCGKYQKQAQSPATLKKSIWSSSGFGSGSGAGSSKLRSSRRNPDADQSKGALGRLFSTSLLDDRR